MQTRIAAVQLEFQYFATPQEFADWVRAPIEDAVQRGAEWIVLPHSTSSSLFGMFDPDAQTHDALDDLARRQHMPTREWLAERAGYVFEFYVHLFQSLAGRVEAWLAPGTVLEPADGTFYITACLFNPAGEMVGHQRQMHRAVQEIAWGVSQGDALRVFETERGDFGFVLGEDIRYPETARALTLNGANVLVHPAAVHAAAGEQLLPDLWRDVQGNQTFGVQANLTGGGWYGRSAIYAPVEYTPDKRGVLVQAADEKQTILLADLEFERLARVRAAYPKTIQGARK